MTIEHVRAQLRRAIDETFRYCSCDIQVAPEAIERAVEHAESLVLPAISDLVQEALEEGFNGRADLCLS
jgi:hypothetical protein